MQLKPDCMRALRFYLNRTGLFQNVDSNVQPTGKGYVVEFSFREKVWPGMVEFKVSGATVLPDDIEEQVLREARKSKYTTVRVLATAKNIIEGYYQVCLHTLSELRISVKSLHVCSLVE